MIDKGVVELWVLMKVDSEVWFDRNEFLNFRVPVTCSEQFVLWRKTNVCLL